MNLKNLFLGSLLGGVTNFLLGWLFYGLLLANYFPEGEDMNLLFIFLGCLAFGVILTYIFIRWASISTWISGAAAGAILGTLLGFWGNFFMWAERAEVDYGLFALDLGVSAAMGAITGATIGFVLGKLK